MFQVKIIELKEQSVTTDNNIDTLTFNLDTSAMRAPGNIQFGSRFPAVSKFPNLFRFLVQEL